MKQPDEFHGQGGSYIVENGARRRVEESTKDHPEGNRPRDADGKPLDALPAPEQPVVEKSAPRRSPAAARASGD